MRRIRVIVDNRDAAEVYLSVRTTAEGVLGATETTRLYNYARFLEDKYVEQASEVYSKILKCHPGYLDAYFRMGCIELASGDKDKAKSLFLRANEIDSQSIIARLLLAKSVSVKDSRKVLEGVMKECDTRDGYALCALGNFYVGCVRGEVNKETRALVIKKAEEFYEKCLAGDAKCAFAALGLGVCFAEEKKWEEARGVFSQVSIVGNFDAGVNLGHCLCELGMHESAVAVFEGIIAKYGKKDNVMLFVAQACYVVGKGRKDVGMIERAVAWMKDIEAKADMVMYDLALCQLQLMVVLVSDELKERRTVLILEAAMVEAVEAEACFKEYVGGDKGVDKRVASEMFKYCSDIIRVGEKKLHEGKVMQNQKEQRIREMHDLRRAQELQKMEDAEKEQKAKEAREMVIKEQREFLATKMRFEYQKTRDEEDGQAKRKKQKVNVIEDDDE